MERCLLDGRREIGRNIRMVRVGLNGGQAPADVVRIKGFGAWGLQKQSIKPVKIGRGRGRGQIEVLEKCSCGHLRFYDE
jgi:hypothetical protein